MPKHKFVDIKEIQDLGILQELNRLLLHPRGMALALHIDEHTGVVTGVAGLLDNRDKKGGMVYGPGLLDLKKKKAFDALAEKNADVRKNELGAVVQPMR